LATETKSSTALETFAREDRTFPPPKGFAAQANAKDPAIYERAEKDLEGFWAEQAKTLAWRKPFSKVLEWEAPYAKWFLGGELNISENCLDRHVRAGQGAKIAYYWEGEPGDSRAITYRDLLDTTSRAANALKELGVKKGDRVAIYMPMIPELPAAMLACARIGAPFTVVFGGFSAEALAGRINDSEAKVLITADGGYRKGGVVPLKKNADDAIAQTKSIEKVLVVRRVKQDVPWTEGRDVWWHDIVDRQKPESPAESLDSEHMLYLLYTSGTTAKPKGIVHTTAGYLAGVATTHKLIFDVKDNDVYWCAADIGWVTGHSYIVFAPLANGTTGVMYEGTPDFPDKDRWWSIIEKYKVSILYCAPTAIRTFMKWGAEYPAKHNMSSLRLLGTVGEPINPEAWLWYNETIGGGRCPIVDTHDRLQAVRAARKLDHHEHLVVRDAVLLRAVDGAGEDVGDGGVAGSEPGSSRREHETVLHEFPPGDPVDAYLVHRRTPYLRLNSGLARSAYQRPRSSFVFASSVAVRGPSTPSRNFASAPANAGNVRVWPSAVLTKFARCSIVFDEIQYALSPQPPTLGGSNRVCPRPFAFARIVRVRVWEFSAFATETMYSVGDFTSTRYVSGAVNSGLSSISRTSARVS